MKKLWIAIRTWLNAQPDGEIFIVEPEPFVSLEDGIEQYFATIDEPQALCTFHRSRAILVGRKLLKRERSDKGTKRVGKLGLPSDVRLSEPVVDGGETA